MVSNTPLGDPLSDISLGNDEKGEVSEEISFKDEADVVSKAPSRSPREAPQAPGPVRSPLDADEPAPATADTSSPSREDPEHLGAARVDTMASYGQLMGSGNYSEDDNLFAVRTDGSGGGPSVPQQSRALRLQALHIEVKDPVKKQEQGTFPTFNSQYISYLVLARTSLPSYPRKEMSVRRRFRDFVALADLLKLTHRGYFIPPRPEKSAVAPAGMSKEAVENRQVALEHYLRQLAAHPVLCESEALQVFLTAEGQLTNSAEWLQLHPMSATVLEGISRLPKQLLGQDRVIPLPTEAAQSAKASNDILRFFKEGVTSLKVDFKDVQASSEDETLLRNERIEVDEFQERVMRASRKAEKVVAKFEEVANGLGDLGLSLIRLAKFEEEESIRKGTYTVVAAACKSMVADTKRVGMASVRLTRLGRNAIMPITQALSPLHDHLALTPAVKKGLKEREDALLTHYSIGQDLEKKRAAIGALQEQEQKTFGGDRAKTRKVTNLQNDVAALETALDAASAEYDKVKARNIEEVQRLNKDRASDFQAMLDAFVQVEAAYHDRSVSVWHDVISQMGGDPKGARPVKP